MTRFGRLLMVPAAILGVVMVTAGCRPRTLNEPETILIAGDAPVPTDVVIVVASDADANRGNPVHMMVRSVDAKTLSIESYETAAELLFASPPDPSVLDATVIFPARRVQRTITPRNDEALGVYFFVADEDPARWRVALIASHAQTYCVRISATGATLEDCHQRGASTFEA